MCKNDGHELYAFGDLYWVESIDDRRSINRYYIFLGDNLVSWKFTKQNVVFSSIEAEYKAIFSIVSKLVWLKSLFSEL